MKLADWLNSQQPPVTQNVFAERIGVTQAAVARYANSNRIPRPIIMAAISRETAGKVTAQDFYDGVHTPAAGVAA